MNKRLEEELNRALIQSRGLHASNVTRDYLPLFIRVGKENPSKLLPVIEEFKKATEANRSNLVSALYSVAKIAVKTPFF